MGGVQIPFVFFFSSIFSLFFLLFPFFFLPLHRYFRYFSDITPIFYIFPILSSIFVRYVHGYVPKYP